MTNKEIIVSKWLAEKLLGFVIQDRPQSVIIFDDNWGKWKTVRITDTRNNPLMQPSVIISGWSDVIPNLIEVRICNFWIKNHGLTGKTLSKIEDFLSVNDITGGLVDYIGGYTIYKGNTSYILKKMSTESPEDVIAGLI